MCLVLIWILLCQFAIKSSGYVIIANVDDAIGTKLFDARLTHNPLEDRIYYINVDRSADFIKSLVHVDKNTGVVYLKQQLKCSGIEYPNIFTLYVDSVSNGTVEYVSVPIRLYINGCENTSDGEYEDRIEYSYHISELRQWASDTLVAYALPGTSTHSSDPSRETCFQKSQLVMPLTNTVFPKELTSTCRIQYIDGSDTRLTFEASAGDLVAAVDFCEPLDPPWRIKILVKYSCDGNQRLLSPAEHSIKLVFWHRKEENEISRVRRDTQNDGSTENKAPSFDKALYVASAMEEQPPGVSVCTVHAKSIDGGEVSYQMIPLLDSRSHSMFSIDTKTGVVTTAVVLDREQLDVHYFRVQAVDLSYRPFSSTTTLQVNVLDANDHTPLFEALNGEYEATIRESAPAGSVVTTVRATDKDIGHNGEIEYNIQSVDGGGTASSYSDTFSLDSSTGVLTTRSSLDRETTEVYTVIVTANDQALPITERRSSSATVVVRVTDENDNYPQFAERTYSVVVPEDTPANQNTVIATVKATDMDEGQNAAIRYAIIGGNTQAQFSIDSQNGEVMLIKPLDYETMRSYRLIIRAQDGGSPSRSNTTQLLVNVKDVNDNAPKFYSETFHESVLENVPVGFSIVRVQAYDADEGENAAIKYSIADRDMRGDTTDNLPIAIDEKTGWVHTVRSLDRETNGRYAILVVAQDGGVPPKYGSASVSIVVQDVNDNDPVFNPKIYEAVISEDDPPGTPVCSVVATDPDENPRLRYEISSGNERRRFTITTQNARGLVTISQPLDYKQEKRVVLSVRVYDFDGRFDVATVYINVTDANNFPPVFENAPYTATIFEDAPVGSTVLIVAATDGDDGQNAQITYSLAGVAGETTEFNINPQTGAIVTTKPLDREIMSGYLLTVTAKDGGVPSLSDTTDVEISVADINDNPPVFLKSSYMGSVSEDALVGTSVLQVSATDVDTGLNGRIRYALREGTEAFVIDMTSGVIRTAMPLDRESVAQYNIEALAIDRGNPPLTGSTTVRIKIEDINDSPPTFESDKLIFYIPENSPIGTLVGELYAKDPDEGQNAIVQYSIIGGEDANSFQLIRRQGSEKAELLTMIDVDYESPKKKYSLVVRAASPPLRTDAHVEILVTDVNDNAPQLKDFQVIFNNFKDCFPTGPFGRIPAFDADVSSKLRYRILSGNNANLVHLDEVTGMLTLSSQLNTNVNKNAFMEVSVTDGINEVKSSMQLIVRLVTEDMLYNSVTVRFSQMTVEAFLSPLLMYFVDGLAAIIPCPKENIYVFSVQEDTDINARILNVSFSARRVDGRFYTPQYLQERVYLNRIVLSKLSTAQILSFDDNLCVQEPCLNFEQCLSILKFGNASQFISSDTVLFRPIYPVSTFACRCPSGFTGSNEHYMCDIEVNLCYSNPCQNGGTCKRKEGGYTCLCLSKYTGDNCEIDLSLSNCESGICHSGSTCTPLPEGGFACDDCAQTGTFEHYDRICQLRGRSFPKNSFLTFSSLKQRHRFHLSLKFATMEESGLLLYNGRYNELHDFICLEITDGGQSVQFSFSLGSDIAKVSASLPSGVNDGNWHVVTILYYNRTATITLDDCDTGLTIKYGHKLGYLCANTSTLILEPRCDHLTETCHRYMDLTGPLQIGGLPSFLSSTATHIPNKDFIGCIADIHVDYKLLDFNSYVADNGTVVGCPERLPHCIENPCKNGGTCSDSWNTFHCDCPNGWSGKDCSEAVSPAWRFNGKGILSFNPLLRPIQLPWILSLSIRTLQPDSFVMSVVIGQNNSATISLEGGFIVHMLDGQMVTLTTGRVNDGLWHRVDITWLVGGGVRTSLDYGRRAITRILNVKLQGLFMGKITIGSHEEEKLNGKIYSPFVGCIQDVRMGTSQTLLQRATAMNNVQEGCDSADPCAKNVCPAHSSCKPHWEKYTCACDVGYVGASCSPVCETNPCYEFATCIEDKDNSRGYRCVCPSYKYSGDYCEERSEDICPASWWGDPVCGPCNCPVNLGYNPNCNKTTGECSCKENYYQIEGSKKCIPCDCYPTGSYDQTCDYRTGQCRCRNGAIGKRCDTCPNEYAEVTLRGCEVIYDKCPANFADGVWWSRTDFGSIDTESCPMGSEGKVTRLCDDIMGRWKSADIFNCTSDKFESLRKLLLNVINDNSTMDITTYIAIESSLLLKEATNNTDLLYGNDVLIAEQAIQRLLMYEHSQYGLNLTHSQDKDYIQNLILAISRIIDVSQSEQWKKIRKITNETPDVIIRTVVAYLETLATNQRDTYTEPFEVVTGNMAFGLDLVTVESLFGYENSGKLDQDLLGVQTETVMLPDTSSLLDTALSVNPNKAGLGFKSQTSPTIVFPKYNNYEFEKSKFDLNSRIMIPMDLLGIREIRRGEVTVQDDIKWSDSAVIGYVQYRNLGALLPIRYDDTVSKRWGVDLMVASPIMSIVIALNKRFDSNLDMYSTSLLNVVPLPSPIRLRLWLKYGYVSPKSNPQCVRWTTNRGYGEWTRAGCITDIPDGQWDKTATILINCTCNQLSTYAVLMDAVGMDYVAEFSFTEQVSSTIGFTIAVVALMATYALLSILRAKTNSSCICLNHTLCLLLTQCLFLLALKDRSKMVSDDVFCKLTAIGLHYLWLTVISWYLVSVLHLYRMLTEMRDVNHGQMGFYRALGYGLPAVIVALAVGVKTEQYGNYYFCWLSLYESVVWSLVGPISILVICILIILVMSLRAAFTLKEHVSGYGNLRTLLWLSVVSLPLLVAVWMLELLVATERDELLTYALSVISAIQAIFMFCAIFFGNARVRMSVRRMLLRITGRKVPPLPEEDIDSPVRTTVLSPNNPPRSALSYRNAGVNTYEAARRQIGISASSTTSRSTGKTSSSPYRSDGQMRHTSTSTSNYDHSASDGPSNFQHVHHTSDSDSEGSACRRSLDLASSHSSDDDDCSTKPERNRKNAGVSIRESELTEYLPNVVQDSVNRRPSIQPPCHLNVMANSQLFPNPKLYHNIMASPQWPASPLTNGNNTEMEENTYGEGNWRNSGVSDYENSIISGNCMNVHYLKQRPFEGDYEEAVTNNGNEKYSFPYTAEEDHCPSPQHNGVSVGSSFERNGNVRTSLRSETRGGYGGSHDINRSAEISSLRSLDMNRRIHSSHTSIERRALDETPKRSGDFILEGTIPSNYNGRRGSDMSLKSIEISSRIDNMESPVLHEQRLANASSALLQRRPIYGSNEFTIAESEKDTSETCV